MEKACQEFTRYFYKAYSAGNSTVCDAFQEAKEHLKSIKDLPRGEGNKFILLNQCGDKCKALAQEMPNILTDESKKLKFEDITPTQKFNKIPPRVEFFQGRHVELHEIFCLVKKQRFVTIKGIPGIGKSSLCREIANYVYERNIFKDGIIYISLSGCDTIEGLMGIFETEIGVPDRGLSGKVIKELLLLGLCGKLYIHV